MKAKGKKLISLFLVFSLMMLSANLYAKERRGAKLIITKKDGQQIKGELITVKPNSLLLLNTEGKDVSVDIADINVIRIVKKSMYRMGMGMVIGGLTAAGIGALIGFSKGDDPNLAIQWGLTAEGKALVYGLLVGGLGIFLGGIIGVIAG
ncbi:unnamed protein product, partial [marine sediment metagenome]